MSELALRLPPEFVDAVAIRVVEIIEGEYGRAGRAENPSPYRTVGEAAEYLRTSRQRIYDLCSEGRLTRHKDGSRLLVLIDELDALVARG